MQTKQLWWFVLVLVLVVLALAGQRYRQQFATPSVIDTVTAPKACDLTQTSCSVRFADGQELDFSLQPNPVPVLKPLRLAVQLSPPATPAVRQDIEVDFVGVDMDMGFNRVKLERQDADHYTGTGVLSLCTRKRMEWEARVLLHTGKGIKMAIFPFYTIYQ